jgi:hypothetical protein
MHLEADSMPLVEVDDLPTTPEELTARWFSDALGTDVQMAVVEEIIWGTATKVLMGLRYTEPGIELPATLCVKGCFDERLQAMGASDAYRIEARFFGDIAEKLPIALPRAFFSAIAPNGNQGIVVMEDLRADGGRFGDPCIAFTPDQVAAALEMQARWHAVSGDVAKALAPWLCVGSPAVRAVAKVLLSQSYWDDYYANPESPSLPQTLQDRERLTRAFEALWAYEDVTADVLAHGDAHIGNTFIRQDGTVAFLDWQGVCLAPWSYDAAYFITGALEVTDRRTHERDLLDHYRSALRAVGGPVIDADECWTAYRRHALHGFLWAATPPIMQSVERVRAMAERHLAAIEDLESLTLLGV